MKMTGTRPRGYSQAFSRRLIPQITCADWIHWWWNRGEPAWVFVGAEWPSCDRHEVIRDLSRRIHRNASWRSAAHLFWGYPRHFSNRSMHATASPLARAVIQDIERESPHAHSSLR